MLFLQNMEAFREECNTSKTCKLEEALFHTSEATFVTINTILVIFWDIDSLIKFKL